MSTFHHPVWTDITHTVPDDRDDEAVGAGWVPLEVAKVSASGRDEPAAAHPPRSRRR